MIRQHAGWQGLLEESSFWNGLLPIAIMFGTSLLNLVVLGPATTKVMKQRKHQGWLTVCGWTVYRRSTDDGTETRDGKKYHDPGPKSAEMTRLNSSFSKLHGASSLSNLIGTGAMIFYGVVLAEKL